MSVQSLGNLTEEQITSIAERVKASRDIALPSLKHFNTDPCSAHSERTVGCRNCGLVPRKHQRVGASWAYFKKRCLIADGTGTGKTATAALTIAMAKDAQEFEDGSRVVVVCRAAAVRQWVRELNRMLSGMESVAITGNAKQRLRIYSSSWDIAVLSKEMLLNDVDALDQFKIGFMIVDDVDSIRNQGNKQASAIGRHTQRSERVLILNATPLQKKLEDLWAVLSHVGGEDRLGNFFRFRNRYIQREKITVWTAPKSAGAGPVRRQIQKVVGYKNMDELRERIAPLVLKRTLDDLDDVEMPAIQTNVVMLDMYPRQREKYEELRRGILQIIKDGKVAEVKKVEALAKISYGARICTGLPAIGEDDGEEASSKLDWIVDHLQGDFADDKVVVFAQNKGTVRALQARLADVGISQETIWGEESNATLRQTRIDRFWDDPTCKVLIGTAAIESSLNLHVARHLIFADVVLNQARMTQLAGRVRRQGSAYRTVYAHVLLTEDSQEERYLPLLEREAAVAGYVFNENNDLFDDLDPFTLMQLIIP